MAGPGRQQDPPLSDTLVGEPHAFSFVQAVRLLELERPASERIGFAASGGESVRFSATATLAPPPSDISAFTPADASAEPPEPARMEVTFLGLYGPGSPLPTFFTHELLVADDADRVRDFLDIFNHRLISLMYRAMTKYRMAHFFRPDGGGAFNRSLLALAGLAPGGASEMPDPDVLSLLRYAGILAQQARSSATLETVLRDYLGLPVRIEELIPHWAPVDADQIAFLGEPGFALGEEGSVLDSEVLQFTSRFAIQVGPVGFAEFVRFLPGGDLCREVRALTERLVDDPIDFDLQLLLNADEIPPLVLDCPGATELGRTAWLEWDGRTPAKVRVSFEELQGDHSR